MVEYTEYLPDVTWGGFGSVILWFIIAILFLVGFGIGVFFFIRWLKFNKTVVILEDVQGSDDLEPVGKDKAMLVKVAKSGMEVLYLKKRKVYKGAYGKRMGKNMYYFAIGPDGYWYNVTLGSLEKGMNKIGIRPTPVNMRYQNEALQEIIKQRYNQESWLTKYGGVIAFVVLIMAFGIMAYLMMSKFSEVGSWTAQNLQVVKEVQEETKTIIGALDNLKYGGGYQTAKAWLGLIPKVWGGGYG